VGDPDGGGSASIVGGHVVFDPGSDFVHLAAGTSETVTFDYTMTDEHGAHSTASITVEVDGLNDNATMGGTYTGTVTEDGTLVATGALTVHDVDDGEDGFAGVNNSALHGTYGEFTFDGDSGAWKYTLNNSAANVQALNTGEHRTDTLTVGSYDGTASELITVTINGMNEPIVVDLKATYQVNHGKNESDHQTLNGFHTGDILKMDGPLSYVGFTTSGGNTVVTFMDNGGNAHEQFDITLVGFVGFNSNEVI
jgi:VCBS repeat-containing protein